jgi:tRNA nucleotidyltransferase (CCA-adding enzyme)
MIAEAVTKLCHDISHAGGRALIVGGWVRDRLLGLSESWLDYDIEVYGIAAEPLRARLATHGFVNLVGEAYTVFKVRLREKGRPLVVDVTLPRHESKVGRGHRAFVVTGDPAMSFVEASRRRDFTINAIMYDPLTGEFIDPHGGQADLKLRVLRAVDPKTFIDDSLRVLRAVQFAARLEFTIDEATIALCRQIDLYDLPAERIWGEVEKWLLQSRRPSIGLYAALKLGVIKQLWPELEYLDPAALASALDAARASIDDLDYPRRVVVMLATLCRNLAPLPDSAAQAVQLLLDRLRLNHLDHYDVRRQIIALVRHRDIPVNWNTENQGADRAAAASNGDYRRLAIAVEPALLARVEMAAVRNQDAGAAAAVERFLARVRLLDIETSPPAPLLLGRHVLALGIPPGPEVGRITRAVYQLQLDDEVLILDQAIAAAARIAALTG